RDVGGGVGAGGGGRGDRPQKGGGARPRRERLLHSGFAVRERSLVLSPLREKCSENICAERNSYDAGASGKHALSHWKTGIAKVTDSNRCCDDDCNRYDERRGRSESGLAACGDP